jgi:hypothetical protein
MNDSISIPRIFDAVEKVIRMYDLHLKWQHKKSWKYLSQALAELRTLLLSPSTIDQNVSPSGHEPHEQDDLVPYW